MDYSVVSNNVRLTAATFSSHWTTQLKPESGFAYVAKTSNKSGVSDEIR